MGNENDICAEPEAQEVDVLGNIASTENKSVIDRRHFLAMLTSLAASQMAGAQTWQKVPSAPGSANTWRKIETAPGGSNTWRKLGVATGLFRATISTNQQQLNLANWAAQNGWNGVSAAEITIAPGVYIWSDSVAVAALTTGNFPGGLKIINQGFIMGKGGQGGYGYLNNNFVYHGPAQAGGPAISLGCDATIDSASGYIGGGGGGGGSAGVNATTGYVYGGGGGAGGGYGGQAAGYIFAVWSSPGGVGGSIGTSGAAGTTTGAGGGRVFPSTATVANAGTTVPSIGGPGGGTGYGVAASYQTVTPGLGGGPAQAGGNGVLNTGGYATGGGGGWGAAGGAGACNQGTTPTGMPGAAGGAAVQRNGYSLTWEGGFPLSRVFGLV